MTDAVKLEDEINDGFTERLSWLKGPKPFYGYTFRDWETWDDWCPSEILNGIAYMMAPPSVEHQELSYGLTSQLKDFLQNKPCKAFMGVGVRLEPKEDKSDKQVPIPDIVVVCDEEKIDKFINGAPDFVIEILSPGNKANDLLTKKELYEQAGVKEYWIIDQIKHYRIHKNILIGGRFHEAIIDITEGLKISVETLPGCELGFHNER